MAWHWRCPQCRRAKGIARSVCPRCRHGGGHPARPVVTPSPFSPPSGAAQFPKEWAGFLVGFALAFALQHLIIQTVGSLFPSRAPLPSVWVSLLIPSIAGKIGWEMFAER